MMRKAFLCADWSIADEKKDKDCRVAVVDASGRSVCW
jgi:hypothetical protein